MQKLGLGSARLLPSALAGATVELQEAAEAFRAGHRPTTAQGPTVNQLVPDPLVVPLVVVVGQVLV